MLGVRRDVTLANLSLMNTDWHLRQLRRRPIEDFDPGAAAAIWRPGSDSAGSPIGEAVAGGWVRPTTPVFDMTLEQLDSLPEITRAPEGSIVFDSLLVTVGRNYLTRSDLATILLIRDNLGKRPIYFSWTDGNYPVETLGLGEYLISQGMVRKLNPTPVVGDGERIVLSRHHMGWLDVPRTHALLSDVYHWESATWPRPDGWVDPPSGSILQLYLMVYGGYADYLMERGDMATAAKFDSIATAAQLNLTR
ncbi:MAG TPA: hypothetical protein PLL69_08575 [Gemmatimonadales bacterium]|nr:hypothetical protein [Gemmatimonadales bacterium]